MHPCAHIAAVATRTRLIAALIASVCITPKFALAGFDTTAENRVRGSTHNTTDRIRKNSQLNYEHRLQKSKIFDENASESPVECNLYGYAKNNPLNFVDPDGKSAKD